MLVPAGQLVLALDGIMTGCQPISLACSRCSTESAAATDHFGLDGRRPLISDRQWPQVLRQWRGRGSGGGGCVEVASTAPVVLVRDTTDRGGAVLSVPASAWQAFADTLK